MNLVRFYVHTTALLMVRAEAPLEVSVGTSLHLLLHLFLSLWLSGIVSQLSTKQTSFPLFLYNPLSAS